MNHTKLELEEKTKEELVEIALELQSRILELKGKITDIPESSKIFKTKFLEIKKRNHRFSMRQLAQKVCLSVGKTSEVLSGKSFLNLEQGKKVADVLGFSNSQKEDFLTLITKEVRSRRERRKERRIASSKAWSSSDTNPAK